MPPPLKTRVELRYYKLKCVTPKKLKSIISFHSLRFTQEVSSLKPKIFITRPIPEKVLIQPTVVGTRRVPLPPFVPPQAEGWHTGYAASLKDAG